MDYPAPLIRIRNDGTFDLSEAYGVGVGAWDIHAVRYGYTRFPEGTEAAALAALRRAAREAGLLFIGDDDARPLGSAHPVAHLWDNGADPVAELEHTYRVRRLGLERFGLHNVPPGAPLALLHEVLVPLYLHHRYQVEAAIKLIGGVEYAYAHRDDGRETPGQHPVEAERQRQALATALQSLAPPFLDLPDPVVELLLPRPEGYGAGSVELFAGQAGRVFDPLAAAAAAAEIPVAALLHPQRATRLVEQRRRSPEMPGLEEVLDAVVAAAFLPRNESPGEIEIRRTVQSVVVHGLLRLAADPAASPGVTARAEGVLEALLGRLEQATASRPEAAHRAQLRREIRRYLDRPLAPQPALPGLTPIPPGSPIGASGEGWRSGCGFHH
jgi:hypothetical protein